MQNLTGYIPRPQAYNRILPPLKFLSEADFLYVKFKHAKIVDNDALDDKGLITASLDERGKIVGLVIMEASKCTEECKD